MTEKVAQSLQKDTEPLTLLSGQIKKAKDEIAAWEKFSLPLLQVPKERDYWTHLLADLNERIPKEYIWITDFEPPTQEALRKAPEDPAKDPMKPGDGMPPGKEGAIKAPPVIVKIKGLYLSHDAGNDAGGRVVDEFIASLRQSPFVEPIDTPSAGYVKFTDDKPEWAFKFELPLKLKDPISLR